MSRNTISYRPRKGTLGVLEQIAVDITGWDAKVGGVLPPARSYPPRARSGGRPGRRAGSRASTSLQQAEGLVGCANAHADRRLRRPAQRRTAPTKPRSAFDEFFHTAERAWARAYSAGMRFRISAYSCGGCSVFARRSGDAGAGAGLPGLVHFRSDRPRYPAVRRTARRGRVRRLWVSPSEGQLPTPISQPLLEADIKLGNQGLRPLSG